MGAVEGGVSLLVLGAGVAITFAILYLVALRVLYWGCVAVAVLWRCAQTPAEAAGLPPWQTQAEEWFIALTEGGSMDN